MTIQLLDFAIGDFVCMKSERALSDLRLWQVVEIDSRIDFIKSYVIFDWQCNFQPYWGQTELSCHVSRLTHVSEMVILARILRGDKHCLRPYHYIARNVWSKEDYAGLARDKHYP